MANPFSGIQIIQAPPGKGGFTGGSMLPINPIAMNGVHEMEIPRAYAVVNGQQIALTDYTITWNAHGVLDTAEFTTSMYGNPDFTLQLFQGASDTSPIPAFIFVGFKGQDGQVNYTQAQPGGQVNYTQRFVGQLDQYTIDHKAGTVKFQCRSLGAILGDLRLTTPIVYQTSAQLITAQCAQVGLATNIKIPGAPVQMATVFSREFVAGVKNFRVWDLILQCSQFDDTDVWVDGNTLYYVAPYLLKRTPVNLAVGQDLEDCEMIHAPQYNRKIRVEVRTYVPQTRTGSLTRIQTSADGTVIVSQISKTSTSSPIFGTTGVVTTSYSYNQSTGSYTQVSGSSVKSGGSFNSTTSELADSGLERYIIYKAGLTASEANTLARSIWRKLSMHEYAVTLHLPMRQDLFTHINRYALIELTGSPYQLVNSQYWPRRITETSNLTDGARWQIEMLNHTPPLGGGTA